MINTLAVLLYIFVVRGIQSKPNTTEAALPKNNGTHRIVMIIILGTDLPYQKPVIINQPTVVIVSV